MAKKEKISNFGIDPEPLDFSNETWSWKGEIPNMPIQADGFSYDLIDEDGNDKTALALGILGMIIIVFNAKGPKIREEDVQPVFHQVINTRNWHSLTEKEGNQLGKAAINKLTDAETSSDVFDLASFAPLEVKRALLRKLFVIARYRIKPEFTAEAERRIVEDIVPLIFADPEFELAQLTGLIIRPKNEAEAAPYEVPAERDDFEPDETAETETFSEAEPDAEEALQDQLTSLRQEVPSAAESREAAPQKETYIPFSDMEREQQQTATPEREKPRRSGPAKGQDKRAGFGRPPAEELADNVPAETDIQPVDSGDTRSDNFGYDSVVSAPQDLPQHQQIPMPDLQNVPKPPVPPVPNADLPRQQMPVSGQPYPYPADPNAPYPYPANPARQTPPQGPVPGQPYSYPADPNAPYPYPANPTRQTPPQGPVPGQPYSHPADPNAPYPYPANPAWQTPPQGAVPGQPYAYPVNPQVQYPYPANPAWQTPPQGAVPGQPYPYPADPNAPYPYPANPAWQAPPQEPAQAQNPQSAEPVLPSADSQRPGMKADEQPPQADSDQPSSMEHTQPRKQ